jgi:hypothetical protein
MDWLIVIMTIAFGFPIAYIMIRLLLACDKIDRIYNKLTKLEE